MKITLTQDGGLAAGIHRPPLIVNSKALPTTEIAGLTKLVVGATSSPIQELRPGKARDAITYTIAIEEGDQPVVLRQSDADMSPEFAALLAWLQKLGDTN